MPILLALLSFAAAQEVSGPGASPPATPVEETAPQEAPPDAIQSIGQDPAPAPTEAAAPAPTPESEIIPEEPSGLFHDRREQFLSRRSTGPDLWRTALGTLVVLVLAVATLWGVRRFGRGARFLSGAGPLQVLSRRLLDGNSRVYLVRAGRRVIVVGATRERLVTLTEIRDPDEAAAIRAEIEAPDQNQRRLFESRLRDGLKAYEKAERKEAPDPLDSVEKELADLRKKVESWHE